ncbi:hypothetical protein sscle_01g005880 [Sclerotinia sclerotiorum 1980 UF-70]|uniref:Uncharacterized protein n=1 Tax=Sclerotinia sclerotiorum (strain ATCC 18683 / 1980 / Ss-1) TaxID=665079 RepID=A0A1D9PSW4_SCLS1|nr:hypothetical protein sscle_01g005880 [Sclerotinia sclerotiorum 1980 UF-70]
MSPPLLGAIVISLPFLLSSSPLKYSRFLMGNLHRQHLRNTWKPNQSKECPSFGVLYNARNPALVFHANAVLLLFHLAVIPHTEYMSGSIQASLDLQLSCHVMHQLRIKI